MGCDINVNNFMIAEGADHGSAPGEMKVIISEYIKSKQELLAFFEEIMHFPYFGMNWDALQDCFRDLSWLKEDYILIVHSGLPLLSRKDVKIYLSILSDSVADWRAEGGKVFLVAFSRHLWDEILEVAHLS